MKEAPFIHSLFVSYGKEVPREERIPYTVGEKLTSEVLSRLAEHIRSGRAGPPSILSRTPTITTSF